MDRAVSELKFGVDDLIEWYAVYLCHKVTSLYILCGNLYESQEKKQTS